MKATDQNVFGLFSGVGGFELGLKRAGFNIIRLCESDPAARRVLEVRFKETPVEKDVRKIGRLLPETHVLTAGFPCQDLSPIGTRNGINGDKSGVVSNVFRLLRRKRVPWVLIENVPFMLALNKGAGIRFLVDELETLGYRWAYRVVDSRAFGLPQRRRRVYLVASRLVDPAPLLFAEEATERQNTERRDRACGFYWTEGNRGLGWAVDAIPPLKGGSGVGIPSPPAIWLPNGRIVTPDIRDAERLQGFRVDWTKPASDVVKPRYRWRLVGNSITVKVAQWLGEVMNRDPARLDGTPFVLSCDGSWPTAAFGSVKGRFGYVSSAWPVCKTSESLEKFLRYETRLLSEKALAGFVSRLKNSSLNYSREFLMVLENNLQRSRNGGAVSAD